MATLQRTPENTKLEAFIKEILPRIRGVNKTRNKVAHYKWAVSDDKVRGIKISAKGKLTITDDVIPVKELHRASAEMFVLMNELFRMIPLAEFAERMAADGTE